MNGFDFAILIVVLLFAAIGALRGPLHGGANEAAMELIEQFPNADAAEKAAKAVANQLKG